MDPPSGDRPGEDLDWGVQPRPTHFDAAITPTSYAAPWGSGTLDSTYGIGDLYRGLVETGYLHPVIGVSGPCGKAWVGGKYGRGGHGDITTTRLGEVSVTFVGHTPDASIETCWSFPGARPQPTGTVRFFDIGIRGASDSFVVRASTPSDEVYLDGCWWLADRADPTRTYTSGVHQTRTNRLIIRNHLWRGENPADPGIKFREHSVAYIKSVRDITLLENNNLYGGNRTGWQVRPQPSHNPMPTCRTMARGNFGFNLGDNWDPGNGATSDGGAAMTFWVTTQPLYIYDNEIDNFRYKALAVTGQAPDKNFDTGLIHGAQHADVYVGGNRFVPGPITERGTAGFSNVARLTLFNDNHFEGRVTLEGQTAYRYNGLPNGEERLQGPWTQPLFKYDPALGAETLMTEAQILRRIF